MRARVAPFFFSTTAPLSFLSLPLLLTIPSTGVAPIGSGEPASGAPCRPLTPAWPDGLNSSVVARRPARTGTVAATAGVGATAAHAGSGRRGTAVRRGGLG